MKTLTTVKKLLYRSITLVVVVLSMGWVQAGGEKGQQFSNVKVDFCDVGETARGAKILGFDEIELKKEMCVRVSNNNEVPVTINIDIVDGAINEYGNIACYNKSYKGSIGKFIQNETLSIEVEPGQSIEEKIVLERESGTLGQFFGCIHYYLDASKSSGMFQANIGSTKKFIIDIAGKLVARIKLTSPDGNEENRIYIEKKINRLKAILKIINEGNVGQKGFYSGSVDRLVGEPKEFNGNFFLQGGENKELVEQLDLPRYAMFGKLEMKLSFEPQVTLGYHDAAYDPAEKMEKQHYDLTENIINYYLLFIVVCLIVVEMRYLSYRKRKHRHLSAVLNNGNQGGGHCMPPTGYYDQKNIATSQANVGSYYQQNGYMLQASNGQQDMQNTAQNTNNITSRDQYQSNQKLSNASVGVYCENCGNTLNPSVYPEGGLSIIARNKIQDDTYEPGTYQY